MVPACGLEGLHNVWMIGNVLFTLLILHEYIQRRRKVEKSGGVKIL